ncbi:MAG: winged helix-turn-helix domain-containing protein [Planctomycetota bacterium]|nr:winged helix-turn-helix domain-containing protein [Planctomycetota bacterium]
MPFPVWTREAICQLMHMMTGRTYSPRTIRRYLRAWSLSWGGPETGYLFTPKLISFDEHYRRRHAEKSGS